MHATDMHVYVRTYTRQEFAGDNVCMCVCVFVCVRGRHIPDRNSVCVYVRIYICVYVRIYICVYVRIYICVYIYTFAGDNLEIA